MAEQEQPLADEASQEQTRANREGLPLEGFIQSNITIQEVESAANSPPIAKHIAHTEDLISYEGSQEGDLVDSKNDSGIPSS